MPAGAGNHQFDIARCVLGGGLLAGAALVDVGGRGAIIGNLLHIRQEGGDPLMFLGVGRNNTSRHRRRRSRHPSGLTGGAARATAERNDGKATRSTPRSIPWGSSCRCTPPARTHRTAPRRLPWPRRCRTPLASRYAPFDAPLRSRPPHGIASPPLVLCQKPAHATSSDRKD